MPSNAAAPTSPSAAVKRVMGLFRSGAKAPEFWRTPPFRAEPAVLHEHGIRCVGSADGRGMMQTGWAIWQAAGLHQHQSSDFLKDGYRQWTEDGAEPTLRLLFLSDLFDRLVGQPAPHCPANIYLAPPSEVAPTTAYFGTRCWAGTELVVVAQHHDRGLAGSYELPVLDAISTTPRDLIPPASFELARSLARKYGRPDPFGA